MNRPSAEGLALISRLVNALAQRGLSPWTKDKPLVVTRSPWANGLWYWETLMDMSISATIEVSASRLWSTYGRCSCGARKESLDTHPHLEGCPTEKPPYLPCGGSEPRRRKAGVLLQELQR